MTAIKKRKRGQKRTRANNAVLRPHRKVKGVVIALAGDPYGNIQIKDAKATTVAQKINAAMKDGKLIEVGGQYIAPKQVVSVKQTEWVDYS